MTDFIKKIVEKRRREAKFKAAGPGHKLTETSDKSIQQISQDTQQRHEPCEDAKQAGMAALARFEASTSSSIPGFSTATNHPFHNASKSSFSQKKETIGNGLKTSSSEETRVSNSSLFAVQGVFYRCPLLGPEVLSKDEWRAKIRAYLNEALEEERGLTACLIIRSCNKRKDKVEQCISTLTTYLENINLHPDEEKYKKIRVSNKIFQDKVFKIDGALDFLKAAGFENKVLEINGNKEEFLEYNPQLSSQENLQVLLDAIRSSDAIKIELDRNVQVLAPSQASVRVQLPSDFYALSAEEIKREQQSRSEKLETSLMLKTKAMREREEQREMKKYKFAVIRVRFPDSVFLQGTFGVYEKLEVVKAFIDENLLTKGNFILSTGLGSHFSESDYGSSLLDLHLVPATVLHFSWHPDEEINTYLNPELLLRIEDMPT